MKRNHQIGKFPARTLATLLVLGAGLTLTVQPMLAKEHIQKAGYTLVGKTVLQNAKATDLFLRKDEQGHKYLYVVYADDTLAVLNVTNGVEVSETHRLALATNAPTLHMEPLNSRFAAATNAPEPDRQFAVVDMKDAAKPEIAKEFKNVDCYTIDPGDETLYVISDGALSIMRFNRPITRDAELFEQSYNAR
jgi:hypothetical protein